VNWEQPSTTIGKLQLLLLGAQIAARGALNQNLYSNLAPRLSKCKSENAQSQHFDVLSNANFFIKIGFLLLN
jgi:hypothetical protein